MNKRKIVKEIINPYMDKNGFTLESMSGEIGLIERKSMRLYWR